MNHKKVNWLFLTLILVDFAWSACLIILLLSGNPVASNIPLVASMLISELLIVVPALLFLLANKQHTRTGSINEMLGFRKMKISSFFMTVLFTFLIMPMATAINAVSMLFVDNVVNEISGDVLQIPFLVMLFMIGILGPFCEEFVFRGVIYTGYKNSGPVWWAFFWSALLFALMHLNFNQAAYALALGFMFGLLVEATGSLWSSVVAHIVFNSEQVCMMYLAEYIMPEAYPSTEPALTQDVLLAAIGPYLIAAVIATPIAFCVLVWLAKNEDRDGFLRIVWEHRKDKGGAFVSIPLIIAIIICLVYMSLEWILPFFSSFIE